MIASCTRNRLWLVASIYHRTTCPWYKRIQSYTYAVTLSAVSDEPMTCTLPPSVRANWTAKVNSRLWRRPVLRVGGISDIGVPTAYVHCMGMYWTKQFYENLVEFRNKMSRILYRGMWHGFLTWHAEMSPLQEEWRNCGQRGLCRSKG